MHKKQYNYTNRELLSRFIPYYKKYQKVFFWDMFSSAMTTACELILPILLGYLTDSAQRGAITSALLVKLSIIYAVFKVIEIAGKYFMQSLGHIMGAFIERDMRANVFKHLQSLSDSFYSETKIGQLMARITTDLFDITEFAHHCPEEFFIGFVKLIVTFVILVRLKVSLTLSIFILIPLMIIAAGKKRKDFRDTRMKERKQIGELNSRIEDTLLGVKVVKSFANEELERIKFSTDNNKFVGIKKQTYFNMAQYNMINQTFSAFMYILVIAMGGYYVMIGSMTPGSLVTFVLYLNTLIATVNRLVEFTDQLERGITGIERYCEIMDTKTDIFDSEDAKDMKDVKGNIKFDHVYFQYPDEYDINEKKWVLDDINFEVKTGENVAIVGPSGAGKTTITNLIPRFYDVNRGSVLIDNQDIKNYTLQSLRDNIGIVQQDVYLFSGTVKDNILYGKPDATDEEIVKSAKLAGAYDFIKLLPEGFDTYIGERGVKLSGGQKQRISIARVFLKNPPILILDEATSALDNKSEKIVQQSLDILSKGRTTLTIAHRLSTIINADKILVITEKGIEEMGSHEELLAKKGIYYNLYNTNTKQLFG